MDLLNNSRTIGLGSDTTSNAWDELCGWVIFGIYLALISFLILYCVYQLRSVEYVYEICSVEEAIIQFPVASQNYSEDDDDQTYESFDDNQTNESGVHDYIPYLNNWP